MEEIQIRPRLQGTCDLKNPKLKRNDAELVTERSKLLKKINPFYFHLFFFFKFENAGLSIDAVDECQMTIPDENRNVVEQLAQQHNANVVDCILRTLEYTLISVCVAS
jgi:hypothetical protein